METAPKLLFTLLLLCSSIFSLLITGSEGARRHHHHHHQLKKLFVFGDSYVDTGNTRLANSSSWKFPYGITFPGKPSGRFSDGRVSTDFFAKYLGLKSPIAYRWRKYMPQNSKYGMNFAYGGTGVFDTLASYPNMTTQIDFFQQLIKEKMFTPFDLQNSIALVSVAGNDYSAYLSRGGSQQGLLSFIQQVVKQLVLNLQRINSLGVKKIVVAGLQPLGCIPSITIATQFQQCNDTYNQAVEYHNLLLQQAVDKLNNQTNIYGHGYHSFIILDLYNSFLSVLQQNKTQQQGSMPFNSPILQPCCMGVDSNSYCGSVDASGNKMYTICKDPNSSFFWDSAHPTQAGWTAVYSSLQTNLQQLRFH